jgi:hypothetical protein
VALLRPYVALVLVWCAGLLRYLIERFHGLVELPLSCCVVVDGRYTTINCKRLALVAGISCMYGR